MNRDEKLLKKSAPRFASVPAAVPAAITLLALGGAAVGAPVYRLIVKRLALKQFERLSRGDVTPIVASMTPDVHHYFPGNHTLGGERTSKEAVERWFGRLTRLFPAIRFYVQGVAVSGPPWDTIVALEWTSHAPLPDGASYDNRGAHVIRLHFGKVTSFHAYMDSQRSVAALEHLARHGFDEATAPQIEG